MTLDNYLAYLHALQTYDTSYYRASLHALRTYDARISVFARTLRSKEIGDVCIQADIMYATQEPITFSTQFTVNPLS